MNSPDMARLDARLEKALEDAELVRHPWHALLVDLAEERATSQRRAEGLQSQVREVTRALSEANSQLASSEKERRTLGSLLPVCSSCKKPRSDEALAEDVEHYLRRHAEALPTLGQCPACAGQTGLARGRRRSERIRRLEELLNVARLGEEPLAEDYRALAEQYQKQTRRLEKLTRASDDLQTQLKEAHAALVQTALTDPLTGLANRRALLERLAAEVNRSSRNQRPFSLVMLDLDQGKACNEAHGQEAGDLVLRELAHTLQFHVRNFDLCARWGGDTFVVLLIDAPGEIAWAIAEKLRKLFAERKMPFGGATLRATFSAGVAVHHTGRKLEDTLRSVELALERSKQGGRNRATLADQLDHGRG